MITPDLEKRLDKAGCEHYVFISYPKVLQANVLKCVLTIADVIRQIFRITHQRTSAASYLSMSTAFRRVGNGSLCLNMHFVEAEYLWQCAPGLWPVNQ